MDLKNGVFTSKFFGTVPSPYKKKKNLPGRGLTKVEKHWCRRPWNQRLIPGTDKARKHLWGKNGQF